MPIYEYECQACNKVVEVHAKFSDPPLSQCPECGKGPVTKLISQTSFQLKGGGWYVSDYKSAPKTLPSSAVEAKESSTKSETATSIPEKKEASSQAQDKSVKSDKSSTSTSASTKKT